MEYAKRCPQCNKIMPYRTKKGLNYSIKNNCICSECRKINRKQYKKEYSQRPERKEKTKKYNKEYRKKYYGNPENIAKKKKYMETYRKKSEVIQKRRKYDLDRLKNPKNKLNNNISKSIKDAFKSQNISKNGRHWEDLVGYTLQDLKKHLESLFQPGMTWENQGKDGWHIDHIIPKSFFKYNSTDDVEFKMCWRLENLQPLWEKDNLKKSDKLILWGKEVNIKDVYFKK